jgi:hypothetical protein
VNLALFEDGFFMFSGVKKLKKYFSQIDIMQLFSADTTTFSKKKMGGKFKSEPKQQEILVIIFCLIDLRRAM